MRVHDPRERRGIRIINPDAAPLWRVKLRLAESDRGRNVSREGVGVEAGLGEGDGANVVWLRVVLRHQYLRFKFASQRSASGVRDLRPDSVRVTVRTSFG